MDGEQRHFQHPGGTAVLTSAAYLEGQLTDTLSFDSWLQETMDTASPLAVACRIHIPGKGRGVVFAHSNDKSVPATSLQHSLRR